MQRAEFPRGAAIARRLDVREHCESTNAELVAAVTEQPSDYPHLSVLITDDQRAGRGRLDRTWSAPPGAALAISVLVRIPSVPLSRRGWVPLLAGVAMTEAIRAQVRSDVTLKWPNDVLIDGAKVCGILAEVVPADPDAVVIGSGVNTRMTAEQLPVPTATSLALAGAEPDEDALLAGYLGALDGMLTALGAPGAAAAADARERVRAECSTLGRDVRVLLPGDRVLDGVAVDLDPSGRLVVRRGSESIAVAAGDVIHVR